MDFILWQYKSPLGKTDLHVTLTAKYEFKIKHIPGVIRQKKEIIAINDTGEQLERR